MEYTQDRIFEIHYKDKLEEKRSIRSVMQKHKWISLMVTLLIVLTVVDAVLMVQFYEVLKEL